MVRTKALQVECIAVSRSLINLLSMILLPILTLACVQDTNPSLPFLEKPRDPLRDGLITLKDSAQAVHPVETIQASLMSEQAAKMEMLQNVYGGALPARMQIEKQLLNRYVLVQQSYCDSNVCMEMLARTAKSESMATMGSILSLVHACHRLASHYFLILLC